jgi:hypothetical protein
MQEIGREVLAKQERIDGQPEKRDRLVARRVPRGASDYTPQLRNPAPQFNVQLKLFTAKNLSIPCDHISISSRTKGIEFYFFEIEGISIFPGQAVNFERLAFKIVCLPWK